MQLITTAAYTPCSGLCGVTWGRMGALLMQGLQEALLKLDTSAVRGSV